MSNYGAQEKREPRQHLVMVNANQKDNFQVDCDGENALTLKVKKGDEIKWHCHQEGRPIAYEIVFEKTSPFSTMKDKFQVTKGGDSAFFKVDQGELHESFKYSVNLLSDPRWQHDPEVRIDEL